NDVSWVSELTWQYRCVFDCPGSSNDDEDPILIFRGVDTFADIQVNNQTILHTSNAFRIYTIPVSTLHENNELVITFSSPTIEGKKLEEEYGEMPVWNGDSSRVYVRKPQFQYGWDWGPDLNTVGFESVELINDRYYVDDFFVRYELNEALDVADISFEVEFLFHPGDVEVSIELRDGDERLIDTVHGNTDSKQRICLSYTLDHVKLWYPKNQGSPHLYKITVLVNGKVKSTKQIGFRKVELIQTPEASGRTFYFKINGEPIQILGTNWIPAHSFSSALTHQDYQEWMDLIFNGGYNLIRIWGGGQYENDFLYTLCDEAGIMIWQDFVFACGIYPEVIIPSVTQEVTDQLRRLRNHCSIIIYAGNNEDYQIAESQHRDTNNPNQFPVKVIYEDIIPKKISDLCNFTPYQYGSPYSDPWHKSSDPTIGDLHQWNVWHGTHEPYQKWLKLSGRFVSEFGMLSLPSFTILSKYINESQLYPDSELINFHNKAAGGVETLNKYVWDNFPRPDDTLSLEKWIYLTQLMQSEALSMAYRYWRWNWLDYKTGGIIVWQLNDCWPSVSWSTVDFMKIPKLSYYGIKREIKDVVVGCYRKKIVNEGIPQNMQVVFDNSYSLDVWGFGAGQNLTLEIDFYDDKGEFYHSEVFHNLTFIDNQVNTILEDQKLPQLHEHTILSLKLVKGDDIIARSSDWPQPLKKLSWSNFNSSVNLTYVGNGMVELSTTKPIKGLEIYFKHTNYLLNDNAIDLFPNDTQIIHIENFNETDLRNINYRHLGTI
ncbi:hypothetical protein G210_0809, partial [Candida maltosa Xu316]